VVEGGRAEDQVEGAIRVGQSFGGPHCEPQALVIGRLFESLHHGCRGVDSRQRAGVRAPLGQHSQQVSGAAANVEHPPGRGVHRHGELRRPAGNVMVQAATPAPLVTGGSFVEGSDIAVRRHTGILADGLTTQAMAHHEG
jgi:hypothetical protein